MQIPDGHYLFGTVKVGERGQIVIPRPGGLSHPAGGHHRPGGREVGHRRDQSRRLEAHAKQSLT